MAERASSLSYETKISPIDNEANADTSTDREVSVIIGIRISRNSFKNYKLLNIFILLCGSQHKRDQLQ